MVRPSPGVTSRAAPPARTALTISHHTAQRTAAITTQRRESIWATPMPRDSVNRNPSPAQKAKESCRCRFPLKRASASRYNPANPRRPTRPSTTVRPPEAAVTAALLDRQAGDGLEDAVLALDLLDDELADAGDVGGLHLGDGVVLAGDGVDADDAVLALQLGGHLDGLAGGGADQHVGTHHGRLLRVRVWVARGL